MSRFLLILGAASLAALTPSAPASAQSGPGASGIVDFCKSDVPTNHPSLSVGNCVGSRTTYYVSTYEGWPQHVCSFMQSEQPTDFYLAYNSYVECVRDKAGAFIN